MPAEKTVSAFSNYIVGTCSSVNFNPNDGVTAIVDQLVEQPKADYILYTEDNETVVSKWFIVECTRQTSGFWQCRLLRDVLADNYNAVLNAKSFISKAIIPDDNPLIYNHEPISVNQIKTKEIELKDDTKMAWLVGYIARNTAQKDITLETSVIIEDASLDAWAYKSYINSGVYKTPTADLMFAITTFGRVGPTAYSLWNNMEFVENSFVGFTSDQLLTWKEGGPDTWINQNKRDINNTVQTYEKLYRTRTPNDTDYNSIKTWQGKILKDSNGNYFKINLLETEEVIDQRITTDKQGIFLNSYLVYMFGTQLYDGYTATGDMFKLVHTYKKISVSLIPMTYGSYTISFPAEANRFHLKDAPYDMFCMPYSDDGKVRVSAGSYIINPNKSLTVSIAQQLATALDASLYDLQLLPYCPVTGYRVLDDGSITFDETNTKRYTLVTSSDSTSTVKPAVLIWCTASSGTKNIVIDEPISYTNKKIANQCDMYRLVSPNYNGQFEFNLARNNTPKLDTFNVDFTYMPYNPYIHVNPVFGGLYGQDFNDARGLICGGDFSLARVGSAWEQYQLNNKNYQAIFDRQIQNMDVNRKYQRIEEGVGAFAGVLQNATQGFLLGGGVGAAIGGALGAGAGVGDIALSEGKYNEQKSYATDMHVMQLENIRALPYSLSKTTAFTENNKLFPILEYYTCTSQEKLIVANAIANQGMTTELIGNIGNYIYNDWSYETVSDRGFIKATIIQIDIEDDMHMANAISEELQKGVYFK